MEKVDLKDGTANAERGAGIAKAILSWNCRTAESRGKAARPAQSTAETRIAGRGKCPFGL